MYKLINGQLTINDNPILTKEGYITNPTRDILIKEGYKDLINNIPSYDEATEYVNIVGYTEDETNIYVQYSLNDIEVSN